MPSKFDELPLDVIKYEILPFVADDYFARMSINGMLEPVERTSTPLRKNAVAELDMSLTVLNYKKRKLDVDIRGATPTPSKIAEKLMEIFDFSIDNPLLLKYDIKYRNVMIKKAGAYADPNFVDYGYVSEDEKVKLVLKANQALEALDKNPYICECRPSFRNEKWSPIDGANSHVIIDNTELLEKIRRSTPHWRNIGIKRDRPSPLSRSRRCYEADEYQNRDDYVYGYFDSNDAWISIHE